ncbi:hypothetical protein FJTKL_03323 [Diaporthe vaccinii]|uniref:Uncharacterized protein n=1 Tax=Diaporthe vaccinii TaxID=105482 RepID=A0ABR4F1R5_9PEZI
MDTGRVNSERLLVSFYATPWTPSYAHDATKQKQSQLQDTRYHFMHHNSHPTGEPRLLPPGQHIGASPVRLCPAVVVIRGLWLLGGVRRGAVRVVARVGRGLAQGLHAGSSRGVVGPQRPLARLVEDDAGVDEKADKGGTREGEQQMLATGHGLYVCVARMLYSQDDDGDDDHDPDGRLDDVGDEEEARRQCPPGALDDADDVEDQAHHHDHQHHDHDRDDGAEARPLIALVLERVVDLVAECANGGESCHICGGVDEHYDNANHPEGDQHALEERRGVADNVLCCHAGRDVRSTVTWESCCRERLFAS